MATKLKPVDVVTVGVGLTGTILAKELTEAGLKVVGLERGGYRDTHPDFDLPNTHDELKYGQRHDLMQNLSRETLTFRNSVSETALPMRQLGSFLPGEGVGGAAVHWNGQTWRFLPWDFETRSRTIARYGNDALAADCTSQDWGVTYNELEPHFDRFEQIYGICGKAGNLQGQIQSGGNPFEGPRSREYPNPPSRESYAGFLFTKAAQLRERACTAATASALAARWARRRTRRPRCCRCCLRTKTTSCARSPTSSASIWTRRRSAR
jgi:gluconate 2-dehydrogenase alpha chain